ncbi:MAG: hypothetical protein DHS20C02_01930 [Micavibrio sp.]|nr:MAG: hypothetical protein DHS20C02_01930 [Micavibrio sp.]
MAAQAMTSSQSSRIEALKAKHSALSMRIEKEQQRPSAASYYLQKLKKQKLVLKEEIEGLGRSSTA